MVPAPCSTRWVATDATNLGSGAPFKGQIDEFRVWNIARTDAEIQADRRVVLSGAEPGLVMYWRLDQIDFLSTPDQSGHGLTGTVLGPTFASTAPGRVYPLLASDADDAVLITTATSDTPGVTPQIQDNNLRLTVSPGTSGTAAITVRALDRKSAGRTDEVRFDFTTDANAIYGSAFADVDRDGVKDPGEAPLENVAVFLDANGNELRELDEPITFSDLNGRYAFTDLALPPRSQVVFSNDFNNGAPAQFTGVTTTESVQGYDGLGAAGNTFSGTFLRIADGGAPTGVATLTLTDLPAHTSIDLGFLLAIIDTWDGSGTGAAPDIFNVTVDGTPVFAETFTNVNQAGFLQGYQPTVPAADLTPGSARFVDRGFAQVATVGDAAYDMSVEPRLQAIPHTGSTLTIRWFGSGGGLEPVTNESWAIDNVKVTLNGPGAAPVQVTEVPPGGWRPTTGTTVVAATSDLVGTRSVPFTEIRPVAEAVDFANLRVADAGADRRSNEGAGVALTGTVTDPDPANGSNISLAWVALDPNGTPVGTGSGSTFSFTPVDDGTYRVRLTATDADDAARTYEDTVFVFVDDVVPTFDAGPDVALGEGSTLTRPLSFTDPGADSWTATVDYGDGSEIVTIPAAELTDRAFDLSHVYTDNGVFTVLVSVTDDDGGTATDTLRVTASNLPPTASGGADQTVAEGAPVVLDATVADPGAGDTHVYRWSVVASNGQVIPDGTNPTFEFEPTDQGTYTVTLAVTDDDGATGADSIIVTATNVSPTLQLSGAATANEGEPYRLTLGPVTDPGTDTVSQYVVHWGDGVTDTLAAAALDAAGRQLTHTYADGTVEQNNRCGAGGRGRDARAGREPGSHCPERGPDPDGIVAQRHNAGRGRQRQP